METDNVNNPTKLSDQLFSVQQSKRDKHRRNQFLSCVPNARMVRNKPEVIEGPDGFPYFTLRAQAAHASGQTIRISEVIDQLIAQGVGVTIHFAAGEPEWIFFYGDIVSFKLFRQFYIEATSDPGGDKKQKKTILLTAPSEKLLPKATRKVIGTFLKRAAGVQKPMVGHAIAGNDPSSAGSMVFNIFRSDFRNVQTFTGIMECLAWFLPRHYGLIELSKEELASEIMVPLLWSPH